MRQDLPGSAALLPFALSGVRWQDFDREHCYHLVETLHKLLCLLAYHNTVLPAESFPCAAFKVDKSTHNDSTSSSQNEATLNTQPVHVQL